MSCIRTVLTGQRDPANPEPLRHAGSGLDAGGFLSLGAISVQIGVHIGFRFGIRDGFRFCIRSGFREGLHNLALQPFCGLLLPLLQPCKLFLTFLKRSLRTLSHEKFLLLSAAR